jgi:hypothetical protein
MPGGFDALPNGKYLVFLEIDVVMADEGTRLKVAEVLINAQKEQICRLQGNGCGSRDIRYYRSSYDGAEVAKNKRDGAITFTSLLYLLGPAHVVVSQRQVPARF